MPWLTTVSNTQDGRWHRDTLKKLSEATRLPGSPGLFAVNVVHSGIPVSFAFVSSPCNRPASLRIQPTSKVQMQSYNKPKKGPIVDLDLHSSCPGLRHV